MANEFIARKGLISSGSVRVTGSLAVTAGITGSFTGSLTGSLFGTSSFAATSSYALNSSNVTVTGSAPLTATNGDLWYENTTGRTYIYYVSASVSQWVLQSDPTYQPSPTLQDFQDVTDLGATTTNAITIQNTTAALSSGSGALVVSGGLGVLGDVRVKDLYANTLTGRLLGAADSASYVTFTNVDNKPTLVSSSAQIDYNSIQNKLSGVISSSTQVAPLLPNGTVSSSAQYPGWVTSSTQVVWSSVNYSSDIVSSSTQVKPLLPAGTVTSSAQYPGWVTSSAQVNTGSFTGSFIGAHTGSILAPGVVSSSAQYPGWVTSSTQVVWSSVNYSAGIVSSSAQVAPLLPNGTVSSSAQYPGWVTSSGQISITATSGYSTFSSSIATKNDIQDVSINALNAATSSYAINSTIQSQLADVVSSSAQVKPLLPVGTVTSSAQYPGWVTASSQIQLDAITGTTFSNASFLIPQNLTVAGTLTAERFITEFVSASIIYESGSSKFGDSADDVMSVTGSIRVLGGNISGSFVGLVSSSAQIDYNSIQNKLSGVISSSTQIQPLLPAGTVSSSAQYPGWVTSSAQIDYNSIQNKLTGVVSSSTQVKPLLPDGTVTSSAQYPGWVTSSTQVNYTQLQNIPSGIVSSSTQFRTITDSFTGSFTGSFAGTFPYASLTGTPTGIVSSSTQVALLLPNGTVSSSAQYSGWITSSTQVVWSSVNYNAGIVSSSAQVAPLLPNGTVSSSAQYPGWITASSQIDITTTTGYTTFSSSLATVDAIQQISLNALNAATSSYAINSTIQSQLAGVVSSSAQVKPLLPGGTVTSSAQYPGWVTSSTQIDYNSIQNKLSSVISSSTQFNALTGTSASYALTASYVANAVVGSGVISSSTQFKTLTDPFTGSFTGSFKGDGSNLTGIAGISTDNYKFVGDGVTTNYILSASYITSSTIVSVDGLNLAPGDDYNITGTTLSLTTAAPSESNVLIKSFIISQNAVGTFTGSLFGTASFAQQAFQAVSASWAPASEGTTVTWNSVTNKPADLVSSSAQVQAFLPGGTVSSSAQYPGWVTSSTQIVWSSVNYSSDIVSSSAQVKPLLPAGTVTSSAQYPGWVTSSAQVNTGSFTGSFIGNFTGSILSAGVVSSSAQYPGWVTSSTQVVWSQVAYSSGIVSSSNQVQPLLPAGTLSSSTQVNAILDADGVFSSSAQVDYNQIQNKLSGVVSSSTQVALFLPNGTVSSSAQYPGWVTSSAQIDYNSIQNKLTGVVSSSTQIKPLLPDGTVTSSAQYPGWVTSSTQIDYNSIQNKLSGVVSSSAQVKPLLPDGTISSSTQVNAILDADGVFSSSAQVQLNGITGTTFATADFTFPQNLTVAGTLTAERFVTEFVSASIIYESGSSKFGDTNDDIMSVTGSIRVLGGNISGSFVGLVSSSAQIDYNNIQNKLSGVISSSTQIQPLLPNGTVSSSAQYPGWVTASSQIDYNSIQNKLSGVVSSSAQVAPLLPNGTVSSSAQYPGWVTASSQIVWASVNYSTGIVSSSTQVQPLLPNGTVSSSTQYPGWVTASSQIDITATTNYTTFSSSLATVDATQQASINSLNAATSSYAINSTIQSQLANVVSSSSQVKTLLPDGTVSSSAQYPGWVTASSQIDYNSIQNKLSGVYSSSTFTSPSQGTARISFNGNALADVDLGLQTGDSPTFSGLTSTGTVLLQGIYSSSTQVDYNSIQNKLDGVISSSTQFNALSNTSASFATTANVSNNFSPNTVKLTVGTTAPTSPSINDLWVDTN